MHEQLKRLNKELKDKTPAKVERWLNTKDGVKRQYTDVNGKRHWQRLPKDIWKDLDATGRKDLLDRLNDTDWKLAEALKAYEIKSAFIPPNLLSEFERKLHRDTKKQTADTRYQNLVKYCLEFFLPRSPNPTVWQRDLQGEWVDYLVGLGLAPSTYKHIKTALNKFMRFLATKRPDIPVLIFDGLSSYQIAEIKETREARGLGVRRYIPVRDYSAIYEASDDRLKPYVAIAYAYGLRRNEIRALTPGCVMTKHLAVNTQLTDEGKHILPKHRKTRKVPHWLMRPKDLLNHVKSLKPYATGSQLSEAFTEVTSRLHKEGEIHSSYVLHDCRHSFISQVVKDHTLDEVMLAAGHADLRTTSDYLKDTRELEDEVFDPTGS